jgi:simple sugar transport system permease protein
MIFDADFVVTAIRLATPLAYAALGGLICERAGVINLGLEGLMLMGAICGNIAAVLTGSLAVGVLAGVLSGLVFGLLIGYIVMEIKADQLVTGIGFNIFALGLSSFFQELFFGSKSGQEAGYTPAFPVLQGNWIAAIPFFGTVVGGQTVLSLAILALPLIIAFVLRRTGIGLAVRVVGENARMADSVGISVPRVRMSAFVTGSAFAGLGGADLALAEVNHFIADMTAGRGYLALTAVILGRWHPLPTLLICLVLGATDALQFRMQTLQLPVVPQLWFSLPYIAALLLLLSAGRRAIAPADDGVPYYRE